jgi:hypothetical protein
LVGFDPEDAALLHDVEAERLHSTPEQGEDLVARNRLGEPQRDPPSGELPVDDVHSSGLRERGDHQPHIGILEVDPHPTRYG